MRLARGAGAEARQAGLCVAAFYGNAAVLQHLVDVGTPANGFAPAGFHPHASALHHAVDSGSAAAVRVLVEAGADLTCRDRVYDGTPLDWAEYLKREDIAAYLRGLH